MHSSGMRMVRCSGRLGGVCRGGGGVCLQGVPAYRAVFAQGECKPPRLWIDRCL